MAEILVEKDAHVLYLTLNRPEFRNALTRPMMEHLREELDQARSDGDVRVVVLRGAGDKAFCAGADLQDVLKAKEGGIMVLRDHLALYMKLVATVEEVGKPIIAAVHGYALAGGCGLAVACDITIAAEDAVFSIPEINVGLWGSVISAPLVRAIGLKKTVELAYTGRRVDAREAERLGLINRVVTRDHLETEVRELAESLSAKNPTAMTLGREALLTMQDMPYSTRLRYLHEMVTILCSTENADEGMRAFLEKRQPHWR